MCCLLFGCRSPSFVHFQCVRRSPPAHSPAPQERCERVWAGELLPEIGPFRCSVLAQYSRLQRQNQGGTGLDFQQGNINTAPLHSTYCKKSPVVFGTFGFCNAYFVLFFRLCKFWRCRTSAAGRKNSRHSMHHLSIMVTRKLQFVSRIAQILCFSFYHIAQKTSNKTAKTADIDKIHSKK